MPHKKFSKLSEASSISGFHKEMLLKCDFKKNG